MGDNLPARIFRVARPRRAGLSRDEVAIATDVAVHRAERWAASQKLQADVDAIADGTDAALTAEYNTIDTFASRAAGSAAKSELLARRLEQQSVFNSRAMNNHLRP